MSSNQSGFTLLELLISFTIMAILYLFSLPFTDNFLAKNQLQIIDEHLKNAVHFAKIQAMVRKEPLLLTPLSHLHNWSEGMVLCLDTKKHECNSGSHILYEWKWSRSGWNVDWHGFYSNDYLIFASQLGQSALNGTFNIRRNGKIAEQLVLNRLGRVKKKEFYG